MTAVFIGIGFGEYAGWPFLATPLQNQLSRLMQREVSFNHSVKASPPKNPIQANPAQISPLITTQLEGYADSENA